MIIHTVTTFAERHWNQYAERCVKTYQKYWDPSITLHMFEDSDLESKSSWLKDFKRRHVHRPTDDYRKDVVRFSHKIAAIDIAYFQKHSDMLVWMDADCVTHSPVTKEWIVGLLGEAEFAYLNREKRYPETSFMIFRNCPAVDNLIKNIVHLYVHDTVFRLDEWHDGFVIEAVRKEMSEWGGVKSASLSGSASGLGHPFIHGPLGAKMDHLKGKRKIAGKSLDLKTHRPEPYWS